MIITFGEMLKVDSLCSSFWCCLCLQAC